MTAFSSNQAKKRTAFGWFVWLCGAMVTASIWLYPRFNSKTKGLSRAEEKQRRKALVAGLKKKRMKSGVTAT